MRQQYQGVLIASVTVELELVSTKDVRSVLKGPPGFASHMEEAVDVPFLGVTRVLVTSSIVRLMEVESAVNLRDVTSRPWAVLAFVLLMEAVAAVQ
jgi:hypothetical protein